MLQNSNFINLTAFSLILSLVLKNNIFKFKNKFFIQISGIVMGTICGPSLANIFVSSLEKHWYSLNNPTLYLRFIDDILLITNSNFNMNNFKNQFDNLKLNVISSTSVNFLDLNISINIITNSLTFKLYTKPTNTFSYLLNSSNHPKSIFQNIPKSLFIRIRRICSFYHDYLFFSRTLISQLIKRGFDYHKINKLANVVGGFKRENLLNYKERDSDELNNNIYFKFFYDNSLPFLNKIIKKSWLEFTNKTNYNLYKTTNLYLTNSLQQNIKKTLLFNSKPPRQKKYTTNLCDNLNCNICKFSLPHHFINLKDNFSIKIKNNSDCNSTMSVYFIICNKCKYFYIGQTGRCVKSRIEEHLRDIKNHKLFQNKVTDVSLHFNQLHHNSDSDFNFLIYASNLKEENRKSIESDLINISKNIGAKLMNSHIPSLNLIKNLTFL